ncbi:hypothetical protein SLS53_002068 [Cytospora paraplurivora]|uniref:Uncharacterized protein n=1 Tax=Cytospora paraplurivora TaxID=2898453 RepID=A0AAN9UF22_9PEZI
MAKPRLIILIRHENREIHQTVPDHRVPLTQDGWQQAYDAGRRLRNLLHADDTIQFFTSPYRRTRETTEGILATLTSDEEEPSPFKRNNIKVYEEPRLREQDFGNFQPCSAEMERVWQERADYGHFFYRIPNGESAADAYDRVSGFNESLWRQFGDDDFASVCVLVTHGLMSRVFLMKWYHFSVEYFEDLRNINHCEFLIMTRQKNGKYVLQNKLRTWSELRRERKKKEEKIEKGTLDAVNVRDRATLDRTTSTESVQKPRRWGGCPDGCDHNKSFRIRSALADLVKLDSTSVPQHASAAPSPGTTTSAASTSSPHGIATPSSTTHGTCTPTSIHGSRRSTARRFQSEDDEPSQSECDVSRQGAVASPDGTHSHPISIDNRLRVRDEKRLPENGETSLSIPSVFSARGRDFGGTNSGRTSRAGTYGDSSEDEKSHRPKRDELGLGVITSRVAGMDLDDGNGGSATPGGKRDRSGLGRGISTRPDDSSSSSSSEREEACAHTHAHGHGHAHAHGHVHSHIHSHLHHHARRQDSQNENELADDEREAQGNEDIDDAYELSDIDRAEAVDRSIRGSVY